MTKRHFLSLNAFLCLSIFVAGEFETPPVSAQLALPPDSADAPSALSVNLDIGQETIGTIPPGFVGLSYEKLAMATPLFSDTNKPLINIFRLLGPGGVIRIGGNSVEKHRWNATGVGLVAGEISPSDVDRLAGFLKAVRWTILYGVNLGGNQSGQTNPTLASQEIAYASKSFGAGLIGVEIGNEPEAYASTLNYPSAWNPTSYLSLWESFANPVLLSSPKVPLTGPATYYGSGYAAWLVPFVQTEKKQINLITNHYYRADGRYPTSTIAAMLSYPDARLKSMLTLLSQQGAKHHLPFRIAETNSFSIGGAPGVSNSFASSLWVLDHLLTIAIGGGIGVNIHSGQQSAYAPICDDGKGAVTAIRPILYGIYLFSQVGTGSLLKTTWSDPGNFNLSAYAVQTSADGLKVILINKEERRSLRVQLNLPAGATFQSATTAVLAGRGLASTTGVEIQGQEIAITGVFSPKPPESSPLPLTGKNVTVSLEAASAMLIQLKK